jgi:hypothetical protein
MHGVLVLLRGFVCSDPDAFAGNISIRLYM